MGSGFVIDGNVVQAPGLRVTNWYDNPALRLTRGEDMVPGARAWIRVIVLHTTKGINGGPLLPDLGPRVDAGTRCARYWSGDGRNAGAHLVVDHDGEISCLADLRRETAYHCPKWNTCSVGVEIYQGAQGELYEGQLDVTVRLCDWLTRTFGIQRQLPHRYVGALDRFLLGDETVVGVIGHRDAAKNRGKGDPGNAVYNRLGLGGYESVNYEIREDLDIWRRRQRNLGVPNADGVPGPKTVRALELAGHPHGQWVRRPGDEGYDDDPTAVT